ncbi:MAG: hypothetical protein KJO34_01460, partial [Deltaproteobacteria bacterium]|nr:hypothetical protein [Deltaproteobacteria bacterium]
RYGRHGRHDVKTLFSSKTLKKLLWHVDMLIRAFLFAVQTPLNKLPRCKQRSINRKIMIAPRGGELNPRPPQVDLKKRVCLAATKNLTI